MGKHPLQIYTMWTINYPVVPEPSELIHIYPDFGPEHDLSPECWCHPEFDLQCLNLLVHNVPH